MTTAQIIGAGLISAPMCALVVFMHQSIGPKATGAIWAIALGTTGMVYLGAFLLTGSPS